MRSRVKTRNTRANVDVFDAAWMQGAKPPSGDGVKIGSAATKKKCCAWAAERIFLLVAVSFLGYQLQYIPRAVSDKLLPPWIHYSFHHARNGPLASVIKASIRASSWWLSLFLALGKTFDKSASVEHCKAPLTPLLLPQYHAPLHINVNKKSFYQTWASWYENGALCFAGDLETWGRKKQRNTWLVISWLAKKNEQKKWVVWSDQKGGEKTCQCCVVEENVLAK